MKQIFLTLIAIALLTACQAQNARKDSAGNYHAIKSQPKPGTATGKTFTDLKGNVYQVYTTDKGKLYYTRLSKKGTEYRAYIKTEN